MENLNSLINLLRGLGPWGVIAAIGVTFALRYLRARHPDLITVPKPDAPLTDAERFPLLSKLLGRFGVKAVADLPPEAIETLSVELEDAARMQLESIEEKRAAFAKLAPPAPKAD